MKRLTWAFLVIGATILVGCATKRDTMSKGTTEQVVGKKWQLVELKGNSVASKINGKTPYLEFLSEDGRYAATGGCNGIGGEFELLKNQGIKFQRGMSTMMACPDMSIEQGLGSVFQEATRYSVSDSVLTLSSADTLLATFKTYEETGKDLSGAWNLDYIMEPNSTIEGLFPTKKPSIAFDLENGKVTGSGGCNNYNASVEVSGSSLKFGPVMSTKMACQGTEEHVFFKNLERVTSFSVNETELTLIADDIVVMRFTKNK